MNQAWLSLIAAGLLEIAWAVGIRYTQGWTRLLPSLLVGLSYVLSLVLLSHAMRMLPIATAYVIWVGIGAIGVSLYGVLFLKESLSFLQWACLLLILTGVIGLKFLEKP